MPVERALIRGWMGEKYMGQHDAKAWCKIIGCKQSAVYRCARYKKRIFDVWRLEYEPEYYIGKSFKPEYIPTYKAEEREKYTGPTLREIAKETHERGETYGDYQRREYIVKVNIPAGLTSMRDREEAQKKQQTEPPKEAPQEPPQEAEKGQVKKMTVKDFVDILGDDSTNVTIRRAEENMWLLTAPAHSSVWDSVGGMMVDCVTIPAGNEVVIFARDSENG